MSSLDQSAKRAARQHGQRPAAWKVVIDDFEKIRSFANARLDKSVCFRRVADSGERRPTHLRRMPARRGGTYARSSNIGQIGWVGSPNCLDPLETGPGIEHV